MSIDFMGGRYVVFYHLLNSKDKPKYVKMLRDGNEESWKKFIRWAKESIQIGEEELGETFPTDFKELIFKEHDELIDCMDFPHYFFNILQELPREKKIG